MMDDELKLFENNRLWAEKIKQEDPEFFSRLSKQQTPEYFWIGCADSRVPSNQILNLDPGEVFVHRNIANVVVHSDLNCLSVMQFAVEVLKVKHIIVTGHYGCGGIMTAMKNTQHGLIDNWLRHIKDVYRKHQQEVDSFASEKERVNRLCELNVMEQATNVAKTTIVQNAWKNGHELDVRGYCYSIEDGLLRDLGVCFTSAEQLHPIDRMEPLPSL